MTWTKTLSCPSSPTAKLRSVCKPNVKDSGYVSTVWSTPDDLRLPLRLFNLRRTHEGDVEINAQLDQVFDAIVAGDLEGAQAILDSLS